MMKPRIFYLLLFLIPISLYGQIKINSAGKIGLGGEPDNDYNLRVIGKTKIFDQSAYSIAGLEIVTGYQSSYYGVSVSGTPAQDYMIYVGGVAFATGRWESSDINLKKNIQPIDNRILFQKLNAFEGKTYEYKDDVEIQAFYENINQDNDFEIPAPRFTKGNHYGLIAQELEISFPELVKTEATTQTKAITYSRMVPILMEAIKYLNDEKAALEYNMVRASNSAFLITNNEFINLNYNSLHKEVSIRESFPNPFDYSTTINMFIPDDMVDAKFKIYDHNGIEIQVHSLKKRGDVSITLEPTSQIKSGEYYYILLTDNTCSEIHKMTVTN